MSSAAAYFDKGVWVVRVWPSARRLRLAAPAIVGNPLEATRLVRFLRKIPGVEAVATDPRRGRILLTHTAASPVLEYFAAAPAPEFRARPGERRRRGRSASNRGGGTSDPGWHSLTAQQVLHRLATSPAGLAADEAARRLLAYGPNCLEDIGIRTRLEILLAQVANLPAALLLGSSAISTVLGDLLDAAAILGVVGLNSAIGYGVERKSEDLLTSWRKLEAGVARVIRDGSLLRVATEEVVPGDIIVVKTGDVCPADARVIDAHRLSCNEAPLTGESEPRVKTPGTVAAVAALAERTSMLHAGTVVSSGHGRAAVTATGSQTEVASIGRLLEETRPPVSSLQERLGALANRFAAVGVGGAILSGAIGMLRGRPLASTMRNAVALGVGAIPEGLPVVSTAALVRSMQRMRDHGIVVRRLASAETLGRVSVICADKTGTLTRNSMELEVLEVDGRPVALDSLALSLDDVLDDPVATALAAAALSSDVDVSDNGGRSDIVGSSTEQALVRGAAAAGLDWAALRQRFRRRLLHGREGGRHYVVSVHEAAERPAVAFIKGAPEQVIELCTRDWNGRLDRAARRQLRRRNAALAAAGLRVLAVGWRSLPRKNADGNAGGYTFIGLVGLRDPVREGAAEAVRAARGAGIRTLILTGDQLRTAQSVAQLVGLEGKAIDGTELAKRLAVGDRSVLDDVAVVSRITPAEKLAIVRELQAQGHVVAMAGDGINDAPALKSADVGIAVGIRSSDLARQAADLVLETEDLRSILAAVGEGRVVHDNLRTVVRYLLATNSSELALAIGSDLLAGVEVLNSRQLLWINLLSDTVPALALALEPGDPKVLARPPVRAGASLLPAQARGQIIRDGLLMTAVGAGGLVAGGRDAAFSALLGAQLGYAAVCRLQNRPPTAQFVALMGTAVALQGVALTAPPLRYLLGMRALPTATEVLAFGAGLATPWLLSTSLRDGEVVRRGRGFATTVGDALDDAAAEPAGDSREARGGKRSATQRRQRSIALAQKPRR